jgi:hypothetical protein
MKGGGEEKRGESSLSEFPFGVKESKYEESNAPADQAVKPAIVLDMLET